VFWFPVGTANFSLLHKVQTATGVHAPFYSIRTGSLADRNIPSVAGIRMSGTLIPLPLQLPSR
jgi:hypothetical protein